MEPLNNHTFYKEYAVFYLDGTNDTEKRYSNQRDDTFCHGHRFRRPMDIALEGPKEILGIWLLHLQNLLKT